MTLTKIKNANVEIDKYTLLMKIVTLEDLPLKWLLSQVYDNS